MKTVFLLCTIAGAMSAQINGVSIGGTVDEPTLITNPNKAVMAYVVQKHTTSGHNTVSHVPDIYSLVRGLPLKGPLGLFTGVQKGYINRATGQIEPEGDVLQWELKAVLFADGIYYGDPAEFQRMSQLFYTLRSFARDLQYQGAANWGTVLARTSQLLPKSTLDNDQAALAKDLLALQAADLEAAITRVASLPDVVKGE